MFIALFRIPFFCLLGAVLLIFSVGFSVQNAEAQQDSEIPDTGISGIYEVMVGTDDAGPLLEYFAQFGFRVVREGRMNAQQARALYDVDSGLRSYRLQNGRIDSHGLVRILEWDRLQGEGVGYAPPETIGQRLAASRTRDVVRLWDIYSDARANREPWFATKPVFDDLYGMGEGQSGIINRRVGVREMVVHGEFFNHVFFQRYGYDIPGYGTIASAPLQSSEFTHHSFMIGGDFGQITRYYSEVLGFRAEADVSLAGDYYPGPQRVFQMGPGYSHHYIGFVSPNNICGKLKFFMPRDLANAVDRSADQRVGTRGITLHSLYTPKLRELYESVRTAGFAMTTIQKNEFGNDSFVFTGPDAVSWQIVAQPTRLQNQPLTVREFLRVNN